MYQEPTSRSRGRPQDSPALTLAEELLEGSRLVLLVLPIPKYVALAYLI